MRQKVIFSAACLLIACALQQIGAPQAEAQRPIPTRFMPDLVVREYQFPPAYDKGLRIHVMNIGRATAGPSTLRLTVRKINGTAVGRTMEAPVGTIEPSQGQWVTLDAKGILPNNVSLKETTFRINLDVTTAVIESNEKNNEQWHNL